MAKKTPKNTATKIDFESSPSATDKVSEFKSRATVKMHGVDNSQTYEHPASFAATTKELDPNSLKHFVKHVDIKVKKMDKDEIVFDLIGAEPPLANALRRIMIAEIPTIAIEKVTMWQNTSIIPDENLAHRMGLIPIKADARLFENHTAGEEYTETDSLNFRLHKICTKKDPSAPMILNNTHDEEKLYNNSNVFSGDLEWVPKGDQAKRLGNIRPLHDDILIAKLRPGQEIEMELICEKGIGKTHSKWSPVCTAFYRLLPDIRVEGITGDDAQDLKKICPMGVFDIEDIGGSATAVVKDARACTTCRECLRHPQFEGKVNVGKRKDIFEFHVESLGIFTPAEIVTQSLDTLKQKVHYWMDILENQEL